MFIFASFYSITHADDHVEIGGMAAMQCQIADGADMDDVMKVLAEWDEYGDDNFSEPFSAWIMTPVYMSTADFDLDFVFLGFLLRTNFAKRISPICFGEETLNSSPDNLKISCSKFLMSVVNSAEKLFSISTEHNSPRQCSCHDGSRASICDACGSDSSKPQGDVNLW